MRDIRHPQKGSLILVVLCLLAVLGIGLAAYLAVGNQSMKLSDRSNRTGLSEQLAELGLEEAMRAFNKNDWGGWTTSGTSATWTISGTTATCALTFPATKFGQGVTGAVKIRIDNYNAAQLDSTWSSSANYNINDLVGLNGTWYRSVKSSNSNNNPSTQTDLSWWVPAPIPWTWSSNITYSQYDVVNYNGTWYRCHTSCTNITPTNTANWVSIPAISLSWSAGTNYSFGSIVYYSGAWYYCIKRSGSASNDPTVTTYWAPVVTSTGADAVVGASTYVVGDQFYYGDYIDRTTGWYRCIVAANPYYYGSNNFLDSTKWVASSKPFISWMYRSTSATYYFNNVVYYNGTWYRCKVASSINVPTNTTDWENALTGMWSWSNSSINYNLGDVVYYSTTSQRYRCILAHTSSGTITPANTTYWSSAPLYSRAWDSGKQYSQNDTARYNGVQYFSLLNSNTGQNPATATTYWVGANTGTASYQWNATTAYSVGNYKCYGGVWYKCLAANTGQSPNNTTYWTASWANSCGITMGPPVVYAEGTVNIVGSTSIKTQLRATIAPSPLFPNAAAATTTISANSGGTVDSYDSTTGTYASQVGTSTNYSAVLAAGYTSGTAITLASTAVNGYLAAPSSSSSPYAPLYSSGGSVKGPSSPASPNIDLTRISRSPYIPQFDTLPAGGLATNWATTPKGTALVLSATTNIGTPGATTTSRYYINGDLNLSSSTGDFILNINGPVILYINGDLIMDSGSPNGKINITTTGSAEIHIAGKLTINSGSDGINNNTQDPKKLILICDTSASSAQNYSSATATPSFYGVIYMPNTTNASGLLFDNNSLNIYGALSANKITFSGANANIHYDTSLRYATFGGVDQPFAITEWRELTDATELATMP